MARFNFDMLTNDDFQMAMRYLTSPREPDLTIAPDGLPYLYRWHLQSGDKGPGMYFHVQVASDPERPLHTHPWDNMSVILAGAGYEEHLQKLPPHGDTMVYRRKVGDVIFRQAKQAHRLIMPDHGTYTMTQFAFGPKINEWGFWHPEGFKPYQQVTQLKDGVSVHVKGSDAQRPYPSRDDSNFID